MVKKLSILTLLFFVACVYSADNNQDSALLFGYAVNNKDSNLVDTLLKSGKVDVYSPILYRYRETRFFRVELESGLYRNREGSALHAAAKNFDVSTMNVLVNHGINVKAVDPEGDTVLHLLAEARNSDSGVKDNEAASLMRFFIKKGTDASVRNKWGQTALSIAAGNSSNSACVEALMLDAVGERVQALCDAICDSEPKNISKLLLYGTPIIEEHKDLAEEEIDSVDSKILKKLKKSNHLIKYGTQSKYFVKHCFGWFREKLNDKRNVFQIIKGREIGSKR